MQRSAASSVGEGQSKTVAYLAAARATLRGTHTLDYLSIYYAQKVVLSQLSQLSPLPLTAFNAHWE